MTISVVLSNSEILGFSKFIAPWLLHDALRRLLSVVTPQLSSLLSPHSLPQ